MFEVRSANAYAVLGFSPEEIRRGANCDIVTVHAQYGDFVWSTLERLGVRSADLEDQLQEVFVVVHRRIDSYDGSDPMRAWLYGICRRVAAAYRRRRYVRNEVPSEQVPDVEDDCENPETVASMRQTRSVLHSLLDELDLDRRAVFVMFEIEGMSCEQIAEVLGSPVGTVYSRLHTARKEFHKALVRHQKRESWAVGER